MQFANPVWFWLLIPAALACWRILGARQRLATPFPRIRHFPKAKTTWRTLAYRLAPWLYIPTVLLLVIALARPRRNLSSFRRETNAISIMMVVDVSGSMEALDLSRQDGDKIEYLTRLDVVKEVFHDFIELRPDDLIGLVSFGGYASVLAPLTLDHYALRQILDAVAIPTSMQDPATGNVFNEDERMTAVGDALALASARLREADTTSRVIVLLSDGDSNAGILDPAQATDIAKKLGIRVYTIAVGSTGNAPILVTDPAGRQSIRYAYISFDETTLRKIAADTGGVYFNVRDEAGLSNAMLAINNLETTPVQQQILERYDEKYRGLTLAALSLLTALTLMTALTRKQLL